MTTRTVVIGGGIAGLATAALLAREGHRVRVFERNEQLGGRAGSLEIEGFRFDTGPSWYLMPRVFEHFFELLGTSVAEQFELTLLDPGYRVFGEPSAGEEVPTLTIPHGVEQVAAAFEQREPGSGKRLRNYLESARHTTSMAEQYFLYNPFTRWRSLAVPEVLRSLSKLARLLGTSLASFVSRRFTDPMLQQVLGYPAVFLGTAPDRAPAMYHLMSALDLDEGVQYPMGGFWQVVQRLEYLARESGVEIVTGAEVTEILTRSERSGATVSGVRWVDSDGAAHIEHAHTVVSGADLHHTETALLPPALQSYPQRWWDARQSGPGAVLVLLGVAGKLPELAHHSLFFTKDWGANFDAIFGEEQCVPDPASIYVCRPSATDESVAPADCENLFVLIPVPADVKIGAGGRDGAGDLGVERAADAAIDQIAAWAGIPNLRARITVRQTIGPADFASEFHSWQGGMLGPSHILKQSAMFRAQNESKRVAGLYYAGATTAPGVGVPMCLISAELVLKRIRGDRSAGPTVPRAAAMTAARVVDRASAPGPLQSKARR